MEEAIILHKVMSARGNCFNKSCVAQFEWKRTCTNAIDNTVGPLHSCLFLFCCFQPYLPSWYHLRTTQGLRWQNFWWSAFQECRTHSTGYLLSWLLSWFWLSVPILCYYSPSTRTHLCMSPCSICWPSSLCLMSSSASQSSPRSEPSRSLISHH